MPALLQAPLPLEPYLSLELDRSETRHLLRALGRASAYAVRAADPEERTKARSDADAYDALRDRLLDSATRRDLELRLEDDSDD